MVRSFKHSVYLFFLLVLLGACEGSLNDNSEQWLLVNGVLLANEPVVLDIAYLGDNSTPQIEEAYLESESGQIVALQLIDGQLRGDENDLISANTLYTLEILAEKRNTSARIEVPPQLEVNQVSAQVIPIDEASTGQPIFTVLWQNNIATTQLLVLEEESGVEIPFTVPSGQFSSSFNGPVPGQGATLFDTDFEFYGEHNLLIYAVPEAYEEAFFYRPDPLNGGLNAFPDNVYNGSGFIYGATKIEIPLTISP